jgi:putative hydrolase of the HAD superfamily
MPQIRALLFDLDNTLVDFLKMKWSAVDSAINAMIDAGMDVPFDQAKKRIQEIYDKEGIEYQEVFDRFLFDEYGKIDHKLLACAIIAYRRARDATMVLYPHVKSTLVELARRGYRMAVISDAPAKQAWLRLCSLGLQDFFDAVIAFEDTGERKPHPQPFRKALETMKVKPDEAVMIGDWLERDIKGAKAVGIHTIYARYGCVHYAEEFMPHADHKIDGIREIVEVLNKLNLET